MQPELRLTALQMTDRDNEHPGHPTTQAGELSQMRTTRCHAWYQHTAPHDAWEAARQWETLLKRAPTYTPQTHTHKQGCPEMTAPAQHASLGHNNNSLLARHTHTLPSGVLLALCTP